MLVASLWLAARPAICTFAIDAIGVAITTAEIERRTMAYEAGRRLGVDSRAPVSVPGTTAWAAALAILSRLVVAVGCRPSTGTAGSAALAGRCAGHHLTPVTGWRVLPRSFREAATVVTPVLPR
jgi:hypothetical protein